MTQQETKMQGEIGNKTWPQNHGRRKTIDLQMEVQMIRFVSHQNAQRQLETYSFESKYTVLTKKRTYRLLEKTPRQGQLPQGAI